MARQRRPDRRFLKPQFLQVVAVAASAAPTKDALAADRVTGWACAEPPNLGYDDHAGAGPPPSLDQENSTVPKTWRRPSAVIGESKRRPPPESRS